MPLLPPNGMILVGITTTVPYMGFNITPKVDGQETIQLRTRIPFISMDTAAMLLAVELLN
ncbi:hypothetical protein J5TS2_44570 [Brevibacillus halotolerans]|nr:hypothetical protein J5TS2_44570 [Brevibacillus halotolerans]